MSEYTWNKCGYGLSEMVDGKIRECCRQPKVIQIYWSFHPDIGINAVVLPNEMVCEACIYHLERRRAVLDALDM